MAPLFDHERLNVYQKALAFVSFAGPIIEELSGEVREEAADYGDAMHPEKE